MPVPCSGPNTVARTQARNLRLLKLVIPDSFHMTTSPWKMGIMQTQEAEEDLDALLSNNPFVPAKGGVCFINNLTPELLSLIFEVGSADDDSEVDWDDLLDTMEANERDTHESNIQLNEDEEEANVIRSFDFPAPWISFQIIVSMSVATGAL